MFQPTSATELTVGGTASVRGRLRFEREKGLGLKSLVLGYEYVCMHEIL